MSTTLRGQLAVRVGVGGWVTRFEYDGGGRRMRESAAGLKRRYRWDELARLTELVADDNGEAPAINVVVDALGELASVDGTPLLWDTAHPLGPLTWNREASILGEDGPWALAGRDAARWLSPDWQGTIGDTPRRGAHPPRRARMGPVVGIGGVSAARTHLLPRMGLESPPWILPGVSAMLPPATISPTR
jgi:YD repeat-containing protein